MKRRLFNLAAAVSLVLCAALATTWTAAQWRGVSIGSMDEGSVLRSEYLNKRYYVGFDRRLIVIQWYENDVYKLLNTRYLDPGPKDFYFIRAPDSIAPNGRPWARHGTLTFPYWFALLITAALPAWWCIRHRARQRRARRIAAGLCPTCGYDLRATPERCPECGTEAKPRSAGGATA